MGKRHAVCVSLDENILAKLDTVRDMIPRSRYIEKSIVKYLKEEM